MDELKTALESLEKLRKDVHRGDIEDQLHAIGTFLIRELDEVIDCLENTLEEMEDTTEYIDDLEQQVKDLKVQVGDSE